jgi:hypothetical protein
MKKQTEPPREPFRYGDDFPWNPNLDHKATLKMMRSSASSRSALLVRPRHRAAAVRSGTPVD